MMIRSISLMICLCPPLALAQPSQDVEVRHGTTVDRLAMASTDHLQTPTMLREVHLRLPFPGGRDMNGELLIAHDTASQQFWWVLRNDGVSRLTLDSADWFASHAAIFVTENKIVVFWITGSGHLFVVERKGLAALTLEEAQQKAIDEVRSHTTEIAKGGGFWRKEITDVPLPGERFPIMFWNPPNEAGLLAGRNKVISAAREGKLWKLVLRNQWDQELVLDESYNFVSTRRLDSNATPKDK
jgi:hypothetical protein